MPDLPNLSDTERIELLEEKVRALDRDCTLLGVTRKSSKTYGSRLTDNTRLAAQQLQRILNAALNDTGFDIKSLKSWVHCTQTFEAEFTALVNKLEPEGEGG